MNMIKRIVKSVFHKYASTKIKRQALKNGRIIGLEKRKYIYSTNKLAPMFYLPLYRSEYIQQNIVAKGNYYEFESLNYISKIAEGGAFLKPLKGIVFLI